VLFPGVDPTPEVEQIGLEHDITQDNGKFMNISMGEGQETRAARELEKAAENGTWVMLQNIHLMTAWC